MASGVVLGMILMLRTTPAWSATTCPATLVAPSVSSPSTSDCGEQHLEEDEERLEEELEDREDEEEERAIAAERTAREATDVAEEATEGAQERSELEKTTSHLTYAKVTLKLRVRVLVRHGHSVIDPGETLISVTASIPAQVRIDLRDRGRPVKFFRGESAKGSKYVLHVPWTCRMRARRYTFTVTAYGEGESQTTAGDVIVRHRAFTVNPRTTCAAITHQDEEGRHS